jgi:hypothetical protein
MSIPMSAALATDDLFWNRMPVLLGETFLGLPFEEEQLDRAGRERHNCGGNRMRCSRSSEIRADDAWKEGLAGWQKLAVGLLTRRARL